MLNIEQVNTFVAIVDATSLMGASKRLGLAQPTVSQHLRKLEEALNKQLLQRSRTECRLTQEGETFLPHARALLAMEQRARQGIDKPFLSISASSNIGVYQLPSLLKRFGDLFDVGTRPEVRVSIGTNPEIHRQLESGRTDIGLVEWVEQLEGCTSFQWAREKMVAIVPPNHAWAHRRYVSPKELLHTPMVTGEPGTGTATLLRQVFGDLAKDLGVSMSLGSTEAVKRAVMAGLGVSLVMESAVALEAAQGWLVALPLSGVRLEKPLHAVLPREAQRQKMPLSFLRGVLGVSM